MRRFLFCLLILLTAFRGMVGDAMAYEMTAGLLKTSNAVANAANSDATKSIASSADSMPAKALKDLNSSASTSCHEAGKDSVSEAQVDTSEHSCTACMVCHSPLLERASVESTLPKFVAAFVSPLSITWMSADLIQLQKPPVS